MATSEVKGIIKHVGPVVFSGADNKFRKRDLILTTDYEGDYPQTILIEVAQDKCDDANLSEVVPGDIVTVSFNLRGREWFNENKGYTQVFNTLAYWKMAINKTVAGKQAGAPPQYAPPPANGGFAPPADLGQPAQAQQIPPQQQGFGQQPAPNATPQQAGYTQLPDPNALPF